MIFGNIITPSIDKSLNYITDYRAENATLLLDNYSIIDVCYWLMPHSISLLNASIGLGKLCDPSPLSSLSPFYVYK